MVSTVGSLKKAGRRLPSARRDRPSFDDPDLVIQAVLKGVGIGTAIENTLKKLIARGTPGSGPEGLVPLVPGLFSLLSQPSKSTRRSGRAD